MNNARLLIRLSRLLKKYNLIKQAENVENELLNSIEKDPAPNNDNSLVYMDYLYEKNQTSKADFLRIRNNPDFIGTSFKLLPNKYKPIVKNIFTNHFDWMVKVANLIEVKCPKCKNFSSNLFAATNEARCNKCEPDDDYIDINGNFVCEFTIGTKYKYTDEYFKGSYIALYMGNYNNLGAWWRSF